MANEIFDRETMLDLLVNIIPLFILGFFIIIFAVVSPFGIDPLASSIQFGLIAIPFVLLAVLTYFAGRAVAGSEASGPVYLPGQASVSGAEPLEVPGEADGTELDDTETVAAELDDGDDAGSEEPVRNGTAEDGDTVPDPDGSGTGGVDSDPDAAGSGDSEHSA